MHPFMIFSIVNTGFNFIDQYLLITILVANKFNKVIIILAI